MIPPVSALMAAKQAVEQLQPHQQRVIDEKCKLDEARTKLVTFMATAAFDGLDAAERMRLARQFNHMTDYSLVLGERVAAFAKS